ncbi:MAG TPA: FAD-dependent oxidoreductase [Blastocatellia bacterium]|nr:FAD-dependent oxidoreductase [Blastocatellia bacterium]HMV83415.1 FAD-dependent oxidoreductase [Blastocatellia bacterium]HMX24084.1 FAD-dependent oxidoreductase [Blastocatellia bacterium]HMY74302.1 FAD-dependent oxidoreductase [Blastocatellia bacterium]HMZ20406.1 FAD-dependent oxidoreductase [Blastocatellia bacterium]
MSKSYDAAVIGAGVFGAWTALELQRAGLQVALVDAYGAANNRASSGGESRIIRMGYGADEIYTRWSNRSLARWQELFAQAGKPELFHRTGVLWMARENDPYTPATLNTFKTVGIEFEELRRGELERRFPQINFGDVVWALYEPSSGALLARRAVQTVAETFARNGGDCLLEAAVTPTGTGRLTEAITSDGQRISADVFVFACGPWLPKLFPDLLAGRIHPTRQEVFFFGVPAGSKHFAPPQMPTWIDFGAEMYGLPDLENRGFKVGLDRHGANIDPDTAERNITPALLAEVRDFLAKRFPAMNEAPLLEFRVCQYENTSNGDFLIDRHPDFDNVWLVGGGSGHGFKHGPALGQYVAERITKGGAVEPRFSLATKQVARNRSVF